MDELIQNYDIQLVEPGCSPEIGRWDALVNLDSDIGHVYPYLNAVLPSVQYDHDGQVLVLQEQGQWYAFRPREIRIANVADLAQAQQIVSKLAEKVNTIWRQRDDIVPRFTQRKLASVMDIIMLLPRTNCRQCGYLSCMAYAADLRKAGTRVDACLPLLQPGYAANREKVLALLSGD